MALNPRTPLPDLEMVLADSPFEDATACLQETFKRAGIFTVDDLDNSPRKFTCRVCMVSTHKLIQHIRAYMEGQVNQQAVAEAFAVTSAATEEEE